MRPLFCSFTGVYDRQYITEGADIIDFKHLSGCGMYLDDHAEAVILSEISRFAPEGLHFIDNGNYHYMTRLFASFIKEEFDLITFDHHTDDQPPAFGDLKSCGSWIYDIKNENPYLKDCFLIQKAEDFEKYKPSKRPLYVSVDKDVLSPDVLKTNCDQGDMTEDEFFGMFTEILKTGHIIGIDICGEDVPENDISENEVFNKKVIQLLRDRDPFRDPPYSLRQ